MNRWRNSLTGQLLVMLLLAAAVAVGSFFLMRQAGWYLLDRYFDRVEYVKSCNEKALDSFGKYVKSTELSTEDLDGIQKWENAQKTAYICMSIERDGTILYDDIILGWQDSQGLTEETDESDSEAADDEEEELETAYSLYLQAIVSGEVTFSDGAATVYIFGMYDYQMYNIILIPELLLAVLIFCMIYLRFIKTKINYIRLLESEIKILETGGLEHPITVKGRDELYSLASGLDQMRIALQENIDKEAAAVQANYNLVVQLAHDLRTPLTSLLLYLDLMRTGKYRDDAQLKDYIEKSGKKAVQIREMSNQLFERFLLAKEKELEIETEGSAQYVLEDSISEMAGILGENGLTLSFTPKWPQVRIRVAADYLVRIIDNITSNLVKYADRGEAVKTDIAADEQLMLRFSNKTRQAPDGEQSTGIGIQNISLMMSRMGGSCQVVEAEEHFSILLFFPIIS